MAQYAPKYCELADDSPTYGGVAWVMNDTTIHLATKGPFPLTLHVKSDFSFYLGRSFFLFHLNI